MKKSELKKWAIERLNKPSKLTDEQIQHFLNDGMFTATYTPTSHDVSKRLLFLMDKRITIYRNYELTPCVDVPKFMGEYKFFIEGYENCGWCPESDFGDIFILPNNFISDLSRWNSNHQYALVYNDRQTCIDNFGSYGITCELPFVIGRSYDTNQHDYVLNKLSNPKPQLVLYRNYPDEWVEL